MTRLQVTHTNDLSALALTCSTLHELVSPLIYNRFDIVWPDGTNQAEPRTGVDALTYGLATLVMRQDLFERKRPDDGHSEAGNSDMPGQNEPASVKSRVRRGNTYSHFIKKFSLGNGPPDLVQEYVITKDAGKLLGTMVALAIARMPNLESFIWDMPTGILRDVWIALAERDMPSKLDKIAIRFHDNRKAYQESGLVRSTNSRRQPASQGHPSLSTGDPVLGGLRASFTYSNYHVESPNFSILPALSSIGALEVDELANLDELSLLIAKSAHKLRELRVGISSHLSSSGLASNSRAIQYLDPRNGSSGALDLLFSGLPPCKPLGRSISENTDGKIRFKPLGVQNGSEDVVEISEAQAIDSAVLNQSTGAALNISVKGDQVVFDTLKNGQNYIDGIGETQILGNADLSQLNKWTTTTSVKEMGLADNEEDGDDKSIDPALKATQSSMFASQQKSPEQSDPAIPGGRINEDAIKEHTILDQRSRVVDLSLRIRSRSPQKLLLTHLELERLFLNVGLLQKAVEFSILEHLTLLKCSNSDEIWHSLKDWYAPVKYSSPMATTSPRPFETDANGSQSRLRRTPTSFKPCATPVYRLKLKRIHTDTVSSHLLSFLKETLAPNSLESLFLQDNRDYRSPITMNQIWKGPLRRHRGSLTKLLIDSSDANDKARSRPIAAKKWSLHRDVLSSLLAKAPELRELSISLNYKDLHWFLQQLPNISTLRSLHIPVIADHVNGNHFNIRDVALNVVDVINLRRECELAYLAIRNKCFELVETKVTKSGKKRGAVANGSADDDDDSSADEYVPHLGDDVDVSDEEADDEEDDDDDDGFVGNGAGEVDHDNDQIESSDDEENVVSHPTQTTKIKLREILFFDDRVAIFKARHAKL